MPTYDEMLPDNSGAVTDSDGANGSGKTGFCVKIANAGFATAGTSSRWPLTPSNPLGAIPTKHSIELSSISQSVRRCDELEK